MPARTSTLSAAEHAILFTAPGSGEDDLDEASHPAVPAAGDRRAAAPAVSSPSGDGAADDDPAVPDLLRAEVAALARAQRPRGPRGRWLWAAAVGVLALALAAQGAFLARAAIVAALPASAPWFAAACVRLGCPAPTADTTVSRVELAARDVREHPQYRDALLVNATLVNQATTATPYPVLELTLHDGTGRAVGSRRFAPAEYLDHSIDIAAGMAPGQPVFVVLELGGEAARASSFEFSFL